MGISSWQYLFCFGAIFTSLLTEELNAADPTVCYNYYEVVAARDTLRNASQCSKVWMSLPEQALIQAYLTPETEMLEVGSGFSTMWYSQFVKSYVSVEHDQKWGESVEKMLRDTPGERNVSYHVAPVSEYESKDGDEVEFKVYLDKIDEVSQGRKWDVVLDDGRARIHVAERVLKYLKPTSILIIHDFWKRKYYHSVLESYNVIASVLERQSIVILRPKTISL
eukprot:TRINITY_DN810_c0_g2_i1.p1 TRINITY_DN810_c0_g2~~TRINITY_DN810_c0_g2_i1.p1  ORF type:complete len:223 (-),score=22.51 TRINITY_DN810_c0_g2_i1:236-904(-)